MEKRTPKVQAVLFDLDGTLVNTIGDITVAVNGALALADVGAIDEESCKRYVGSGLKNTLKRALFDANKELPNRQFDQLLQEFFRLYRAKPVVSSYVYPGMHRLLQKCVDSSLCIGILSNKEDSLVNTIVQRLLGTIDFSFVRGVIEGKPMKPDPQCVYEFAESVRVDVKDILYVGDSDVDAETARSAATKLALVGWGFKSPAELIASGYAPICYTVDDLESEVFI